jgi:hypothetical protein
MLVVHSFSRREIRAAAGRIQGGKKETHIYINTVKKTCFCVQQSFTRSSNVGSGNRRSDKIGKEAPFAIPCEKLLPCDVCAADAGKYPSFRGVAQSKLHPKVQFACALNMHR